MALWYSRARLQRQNSSSATAHPAAEERAIQLFSAEAFSCFHDRGYDRENKTQGDAEMALPVRKYPEEWSMEERERLSMVEADVSQLKDGFARLEAKTDGLVVTVAGLSDKISTLALTMEKGFRASDAALAALTSSVEKAFAAMGAANDKRFAEMEIANERRFAAIDMRFAAAESASEKRFAAIDARFAAAESASEKRFAAIDARFAAAEITNERRFAATETANERRFAALDASIASLRLETSKSLHELRIWFLATAAAVLSVMAKAFHWI